MKLKSRQKVSAILILVTAVLAFSVYLIAPDQVLIGYQMVNGVESITFVPKTEGFWRIILAPIIGSFLWNAVAERNERKISAEPELQSYRIRGVFINAAFFVLSSTGMVSAIINLILCL